MKFCEKCGRELSGEKFCPGCGKEIIFENKTNEITETNENANKNGIHKKLHSNIVLEILKLPTEVFSQSFYRAFGEVGTAIHQSEKHTVNLQVRIDTLLNS